MLLKPTSSIITDATSVDSNLVDFDRKTCLDQPGILHNNSSYRLKIGMDDFGSIVEPTSSLAWADVIRANFQRVLYLVIYKNNSTCLSCKAQRGLRTIFIEKSKPKYAYLPKKFIAVWIDWFCVCYDWWRRLQPMSSVFPVRKRAPEIYVHNVWLKRGLNTMHYEALTKIYFMNI